MCDYGASTQLNEWLFTPEGLAACRKRANQEARKYLSENPVVSPTQTPPHHRFASGYTRRVKNGIESPLSQSVDAAPDASPHGHPYLEPDEEALLVAFYVAQIPSLLGPLAQNPYLRREVKVTATAATLFRRFFLSNSVMVHDPKHILVSAAFMATKVEDCMTQVHHLEEGTKLMNSPVTKEEILKAEYPLLGGIDCDLLCFHPYKSVLALTEDLRTFLKTEKGRFLASFPNGEDRPIVGQDLSSIHNAARALVDDVVVSDIPLLFSPGQIGLAALIVANEQINSPEVPKIDLLGYIKHRFEGKDHKTVKSRVLRLSGMLKELKEGKYGCGNYMVDRVKLKAVHKKLKKCKSGEKKAKRKRKAETDASEETNKKTKVEE